MNKALSAAAVKRALQTRGWTQKQLALELGVTAQAVTHWMKGDDFPRPDKLLKLATVLALGFSELVECATEGLPVIAFRKKGSTKTTDAHIQKAMVMGTLLKPLVPFLPEMRSLRAHLASPTTRFETLQAIAAEIRMRIGLGAQAELSYEHLIDQFIENGAIIVPVMWGEKQSHRNALHILLPQEQVTFIFLNLDTRIEDFKFWMAHELAHVYTPELAGSEEGEDFADALAGALLFPKVLAGKAYSDVSQQGTIECEIRELKHWAQAHRISPFSVFCEINRFATAHGLPKLRCKASNIHDLRDTERGRLVSEALFDPLPAEPASYITSAHTMFRSTFFIAAQRMIKEEGTGPGYLQQAMDIPLADAIALHEELSR